MGSVGLLSDSKLLSLKSVMSKPFEFSSFLNCDGAKKAKFSKTSSDERKLSSSMETSKIIYESFFDGICFSVEFAPTARYNDKQTLKCAIVQHRGVLSYVLNRKCNFHLIDDRERAATSSKVAYAKKLGIPVILKDFVFRCLEENRLLDFNDFEIGGARDNFKSGKISGDYKRSLSNQSRTVEHKRPKLLHPVRLSDVPFAEDDKFSHFQLIKWIALKYFEKSSSSDVICVVEIHQNERNNFGKDKYRVAFYSNEAEHPKFRYFETVDDTASIFSQICGDLLSKHGCEKLLSPPIGVGSVQLAELVTPLDENVLELSPHVERLVICLWAEAVGIIEENLSCPLSSLKAKQIEEAESYVMQIKKLLTSRAISDAERKIGMEEAVNKFSTSLPLKNNSMALKLKTLRGVNHVLDFCQVLKDVVSVSESSFWQTRTPTSSMIRALRCFIEVVPPSSNIFDFVLANIKDKGIKIKNVFRLVRPVDFAQFDSTKGNVQLLFHGSRTSNAIGILSRGLLLPNLASQDVGIERTDIGNLGRGIYFSDSFHKSIEYTECGAQFGERVMMICDVALGKVFDTTQPKFDLEQSPVGFDSVRGLAGTDSRKSFFNADEYVIYNLNQQRLKYLVEFSMDSDSPTLMTTKDILAVSMVFGIADEPEIVEETIKSIPKKQIVNAGLVDKTGCKFPLKGLHVRAKMVDLASEIVIFQKFTNPFDRIIEAKYVFPLDDNAAVCGFEAFIGGKHIVGRVEEKVKARKEYTDAVDKGHGAYLMEEEKMNVFTVSIGNLPALCTVLIKITYVSEVILDGDSFCLTLPSAVTPWDEKTALNEIDGLQKVTDSAVIDTGAPDETSLQVSVTMPFEIRKVECPTHPVKIKKTNTLAVVELCSNVSLNANFKLLVDVAEIHFPRMWVENHPSVDSQACMVVFYPEFDSESLSFPIFDIFLDMSNSMAGQPAACTKKASTMILDELNLLPTGCLLNVTKFGSTYDELFVEPKEFKRKAVDAAQTFVNNCHPNMGNSDIFYLLRSANFKSASTVRNVFIISDGHINNEQAIFDFVSNENFAKNNCRLFTFGCSETVNAHFLKTLSRNTGGCYEYLDPSLKSEWHEKIKRQIHRARQPCLTDVRVHWKTSDSDLIHQAPMQISSLFSGERQTVYGFIKHCDQATLTAKVNGTPVSTVVSASAIEKTFGEVVHRLAARAVIRDWEDGGLCEDKIDSQIAKRELQAKIVELSKRFSVVSSLTSFVAVEERQAGELINLEPNVEELLTEEAVDLLPYLGWQVDPTKKDKDVEEEIEYLLRQVEIQRFTSELIALDYIKKAGLLSQSLSNGHPLHEKICGLEEELNKQMAPVTEAKSEEDESEEKDELDGSEESGDLDEEEIERRCALERSKQIEKCLVCDDEYDLRFFEMYAEEIKEAGYVVEPSVDYYETVYCGDDDTSVKEGDGYLKAKCLPEEYDLPHDRSRSRSPSYAPNYAPTSPSYSPTSPEHVNIGTPDLDFEESVEVYESSLELGGESDEKEKRRMMALSDEGSKGRTLFSIKSMIDKTLQSEENLNVKKVKKKQIGSSEIHRTKFETDDCLWSANCSVGSVEVQQEHLMDTTLMSTVECSFEGDGSSSETESSKSTVSPLKQQIGGAQRHSKKLELKDFEFSSERSSSGTLEDDVTIIPPVFFNKGGKNASEQEIHTPALMPPEVNLVQHELCPKRLDEQERGYHSLTGPQIGFLQGKKETEKRSDIAPKLKIRTLDKKSRFSDMPTSETAAFAGGSAMHLFADVSSPTSAARPIFQGFGFGSPASAAVMFGSSAAQVAPQSFGFTPSYPVANPPGAHGFTSSSSMGTPPTSSLFGSMHYQQQVTQRSGLFGASLTPGFTSSRGAHDRFNAFNMSASKAAEPQPFASPPPPPPPSPPPPPPPKPPSAPAMPLMSSAVVLEDLIAELDTLDEESYTERSKLVEAMYKERSAVYSNAQAQSQTPPPLKGTWSSARAKDRVDMFEDVPATGDRGRGRRTTQTARRCTGGKAPSIQLSYRTSSKENAREIISGKSRAVYGRKQSIRDALPRKPITPAEFEFCLRSILHFDKHQQLIICDTIDYLIEATTSTSGHFFVILGFPFDRVWTELDNAGLRSLGESCYAEVVEMLALLVVIVTVGLSCDCEMKSKLETEAFTSSDVKFVDAVCSCVPVDASLTQLFNQTRERLKLICAKHDGIFYQLELAKGLQQFVARLFGYDKKFHE